MHPHTHTHTFRKIKLTLNWKPFWAACDLFFHFSFWVSETRSSWWTRSYVQITSQLLHVKCLLVTFMASCNTLRAYNKKGDAETRERDTDKHSTEMLESCNVRRAVRAALCSFYSFFLIFCLRRWILFCCIILAVNSFVMCSSREMALVVFF